MESVPEAIEDTGQARDKAGEAVGGIGKTTVKDAKAVDDADPELATSSAPSSGLTTRESRLRRPRRARAAQDPAAGS